VLPANVRLDWNLIARYKHSRLFGLVISNKGKKFYNIDTRSGIFRGKIQKFGGRKNSKDHFVDVLEWDTDGGNVVDGVDEAGAAGKFSIQEPI